MCCLICLTSPVLVNVYVVLPLSIYGQVKQPCRFGVAAKCARGCVSCRVKICQFCTNQEVTKVRRATVSDDRLFFEDFTKTFLGVENGLFPMEYFVDVG